MTMKKDFLLIFSDLSATRAPSIQIVSHDNFRVIHKIIPRKLPQVTISRAQKRQKITNSICELRKKSFNQS